MARTADLSIQLDTTRDMAKRARRLALTLFNDDDRNRLLRHAGELDKQVLDLEQQLAAYGAPGMPVMQLQVQQQQQQQAEPQASTASKECGDAR